MSKIHLQASEVEQLAEQLEAVLNYASGLQEIARVHSVTPALPKNSNVMRPDVVVKTDSAPLLAQAPEREDNYFVVPKILKNN